MEFNLASIPVGSNVLTSTLFLYEENTQNNQTIHLHRITNSWVESQVSWNERNAGVPWNTPGGDYITATTVATFTPNIDKQHRQINITSVTQGWVNGTFTNYGLLLRSTGDNGEVKFKSKEEGNSSKQSRLCVTYTLPQAELAVTKTVNNPMPNVANTIAFTVTVTNNGPASATGVVISDTLPSRPDLRSPYPQPGHLHQHYRRMEYGQPSNFYQCYADYYDDRQHRHDRHNHYQYSHPQQFKPN